MLKHLVAAFIVVFLWCAPAFAQTHNGAYTVTTCGTAPNGFNFSGANGSFPGGGLIIDGAGNLYGASQYGGAFNFGAIFKFTP